MAQKAQIAARQVLEQVKETPWLLVCADQLLASLGEHPLRFVSQTLPKRGKRKRTPVLDYARLSLRLGTLPLLDRLPRLPIDIRPLVQLCKVHRDLVELDDGPDAPCEWDYPYFYLEVLAKAKLVEPVFLGRPEEMTECLNLPRGQHVAARRYTADQIGAYRAEWIARWEAEGARLIEEGSIVVAPRSPWLAYLGYDPESAQEPEYEWGVSAPFDGDKLSKLMASGDQEGIAEFFEWTPDVQELRRGQEGPDSCALEERKCLGFRHGLRFTHVPYYLLHPARQAVWNAMQTDLWRTSVLNPSPVTPADDKAWQRLLFRYAVPYREQTTEYERAAAFDAFARKHLRLGMMPKAIAGLPDRERLYPVRPRAKRDESDEAESARRKIQAIKKDMIARGERLASPAGAARRRGKRGTSASG